MDLRNRGKGKYFSSHHWMTPTNMSHPWLKTILLLKWFINVRCCRIIWRRRKDKSDPPFWYQEIQYSTFHFVVLLNGAIHLWRGIQNSCETHEGVELNRPVLHNFSREIHNVQWLQLTYIGLSGHKKVSISPSLQPLLDISLIVIFCNKVYILVLIFNAFYILWHHYTKEII